jgi:hypothetical protein
MGFALADGSANLPPALVKAAQTFVAEMSAAERSSALFDFESEERFNWHFVPKSRNGLPWGKMSVATQTRANALLKASLSESGWKKVSTIRSLEDVLRELEGGNPRRDKNLYTFTVFGKPEQRGTWGWRFEGHHLSLNWTMSGGKVLATSPQFLGTNPGEVRKGPLKGTRGLAVEEDLGRELARSLSPEQRLVGILASDAPSDIITGNSRKAQIAGRKGIEFKMLDARQQGLLLALIQEHASVQLPAVAKARMERAKGSDMNKVVFAWMGGLEPGQGHYYRIQGDAFLIEYDNTQNDANHVHTVWRDFEGDFGDDLLKSHYHAHGSPHRH